MESQFERMFQALAVPSLFRGVGEDVTHLPRGVVADAEQTSGIFVEEPPNRDMQAGSENVRMMKGQVPEAVSVSKDSTWVIRGEAWQTLRIGTLLAGMRRVWVTRRDPGIRDKARSSR